MAVEESYPLKQGYDFLSKLGKNPSVFRLRSLNSFGNDGSPTTHYPLGDAIDPNAGSKKRLKVVTEIGDAVYTKTLTDRTSKFRSQASMLLQAARLNTLSLMGPSSLQRLPTWESLQERAEKMKRARHERYTSGKVDGVNLEAAGDGDEAPAAADLDSDGEEQLNDAEGEVDEEAIRVVN